MTERIQMTDNDLIELRRALGQSIPDAIRVFEHATRLLSSAIDGVFTDPAVEALRDFVAAIQTAADRRSAIADNKRKLRRKRRKGLRRGPGA